VRSVAELLATASGLIAAGAVLEIPGIAGHAAQTSPAALALGLDWVHLVSGSLWIGGLAGLLVLWFSTPPGRRRATLALVVPRFSKVAFVSVMALLIPIFSLVLAAPDIASPAAG
jgi:copper transport protein